MNPFQPPPNARKVQIKEGTVVHTPDSFLALMSSYKRQNPVKFARKEASFKNKFLTLGGKEEDFKIKIEKSREELEVELATLKEQLAKPVLEVKEDSTTGEETPARRGRPRKEEEVTN